MKISATVNLAPEESFFTNFYMGLRAAGAETDLFFCAKSLALAISVFLLIPVVLFAQKREPKGPSTAACSPVVSGVRFSCPAGWSIVDREHPALYDVAIGNYAPSSDREEALILPAGKAEITIHRKPGLYRDLAEWIDATEHGADPDFRETSESFSNGAETIEARCFTSQFDLKKGAGRACLFEFGKVPLMIDLSITRTAAHADELLSLVGKMITSAHLEK